MTQKQVFKNYVEDAKEFILSNIDDRIALHQDFTIYCDNLCKNGEISDYQYQRMNNPFCNKNYKNKVLKMFY